MFTQSPEPQAPITYAIPLIRNNNNNDINFIVERTIETVKILGQYNVKYTEIGLD